MHLKETVLLVQVHFLFAFDFAIRKIRKLGSATFIIINTQEIKSINNVVLSYPDFEKENKF